MFIMINWKVRIRNKMFWLTLIPAVLVLVKEVLELFGVAFDPELISAQLTGLIETVFLILSILGVVNDPTTSGLSDSAQAMTYTEPKQ